MCTERRAMKVPVHVSSNPPQLLPSHVNQKDLNGKSRVSSWSRPPDSGPPSVHSRAGLASYRAPCRSHLRVTGLGSIEATGKL